MSQIMKAFTGIFIVLFMMVSATGVLGGFYQTIHAQNLHAAVINELENSNYARGVLEECFSAAEESGYALEIELYDESGTVVSCSSATDIPSNTMVITMARVVLRYPFQIAFFDIDLMQELFGYAR